MSTDIGSSNFFEIFGLPESFDVDRAVLDAAYRKRQAEHQPVRFAGAGDVERRRAQQLTSLLNDAYHTLRSPLPRAAYLLRLRGIDPEEHDQGQLAHDFLLRQMQLREELESIAAEESLDSLEALKTRVDGEYDETLTGFRRHFDAGEYGQAKAVYHRLQFLSKLHDEIERIEEKILDY